MFRQFLFTAFLTFVGTLLAFSDYMGLVPIRVAGIKFYGADLVVVLVAAAVIFYGFASLLKTRLALFLLFYISFGFLSMTYGYLVGHELNAAVGDFRRLFFYSIAFWITWYLFDSPQRLSRVNSLAYLAVLPIVVMSVLRARQGISWTPRFSAEDVRAVSYVSVTALFLVFYDAATRLLFAGRRDSSPKNIFWLAITGFTFLISNYRLLWTLPLVGALGLVVVAWRKQKASLWRIACTTMLIAGVALLAVVALRMTQSQTYLLIEQKFTQKVLGFQFTDSFRYFVWGAAWRLFRDNWLIGVGLGHRLEYQLLSSIGVWYSRTSTTHNILLEVFYQTGIVGGALFVSLHAGFLIYVWRNLRTLPVEWARPTLVLLFTYLSMFAFGLFQPFLTVPSVAVLFYIVLGITARYVYWGRRNRSELGALP